MLIFLSIINVMCMIAIAYFAWSSSKATTTIQKENKELIFSLIASNLLPPMSKADIDTLYNLYKAQLKHIRQDFESERIRRINHDIINPRRKRSNY